MSSIVRTMYRVITYDSYPLVILSVGAVTMATSLGTLILTRDPVVNVLKKDFLSEDIEEQEQKMGKVYYHHPIRENVGTYEQTTRTDLWGRINQLFGIKK